MKLLRSIRLDASDSFVFEAGADPGEWSVSGAFEFACRNPAGLGGKVRSAFRSGFLGLASLGLRPARRRLVGLFRLTFRNAADVIEKVRGELVYLLMAMTAEHGLRLKPQNLITGLPIRHLEPVN